MTALCLTRPVSVSWSHYIIHLYIHLTISKICDWSYTGRIPIARPYTYCWRLPVTLDRGRRFFDMYKIFRPAHFHAFCSQDNSRSIHVKTNVRQFCALYLLFILSTCERIKKLLKTCIHLLLPSSA